VHWNFGDLFDGCGEVLPEHTPALIHGEHTLTWGELTRRSNNLARAMLDGGAVPGDKVALYLRNCTHYMESVVACLKARLVPVNVNYRYQDRELAYIFSNSDAVVAIYDPEFSAHVEAIKPQLGNLMWLPLGDAYEALATGGDGQPLNIQRSADDLLFIYTGGTTGMPKAVMWRQEDLWHALRGGASAPSNRSEKPVSPAQHLQNLKNFGQVKHQLITCPLMHGTGLFSALTALCGGGSIVTLTAPKLDVAELWSTVQSVGISGMVIVGDAFAKPMLKALDAEPQRWDISSIKVITSSGVMWSPDVKQGLLAHNSKMLLVDAFGSSEAVGFGSSVTSAEETTSSASFAIGADCKVFTEDHREVEPGSGERGFIARPGPIPLGYYKDPKKTAETFPVIDGVRYSIPGDWCTVDTDGTLNLLGRGSACINSGGEKIFPEEIEEALKTHLDVDDALVFGMDDDKWGQAVTAVVAMRSGSNTASEQLRAHVGEQLAHYKTPKAIYSVETMFRAPNGKADYKAAKAYVQNL